MKTINDILGPVRTTKVERRAAQSRKSKRIRSKAKQQIKFGSDTSVLKKFRNGTLSQSSLRSMQVKPYKPIVKDNVNAFAKQKLNVKHKHTILDDDYFKI